ncbi:MAG: 23S rRNA pseudouridine synthase F, partial [Candidatus Pacebacteria bacterium]|nr:23S rRNA pseudouridine synthase F [Candidatus Paceibacterota bacterium]
ERSFKITLTEGKKHQIRRMCEALFLTVRDLKRVRIMNVKLGNIPSGSFRELKGNELKTFLSSLGL